MQGYELVSNYREIYKKGNRAFKMYSEEKSFEYVTKMACIQALAYNAGLPVPTVYGVKNFDGRFALEMDYIEGKHFMDENASEEERIRELKIMAQLQCELNAVNSETFNLPSFSKKIAAEIKQTHYLTESVKREVLTLLSRLDTGKTNLCHGDFHRGNVVYDGDKHWIIDWDGAGTGDQMADICMSYFYKKRVNQHTADIYMQEYCMISNINQDDILAWLPVIAAYQVDIKTEDQRNYILSVINDWYVKKQ